MAIVSESLARTLAPDGDVLERRVRFGGLQRLQDVVIVGIVGNATRGNPRVSNPLVLFTLAATVLLLGTAALPHGVIPSARLTLAVMEHRVTIASSGAAALTAAIVALAVS